MFEGFLNFFRKRNEFSESSAKTVSIAFDRKKTNSLLDSAVQYVELKEGIRLRRTEDYSDSPLLVFCINDSRLQEDINNVKRITRSGNDVMLLVVTDNTKLRLVDTDATEGFGAKHILLWNHERGKFRHKDNHTCIVWLHKFLVRNLKDDQVQVKKSASFIRRGTSFKMITGLYKVLPPLTEELEKSAVVYLEEKHNISLLKTERDNISAPHILLCKSGEHVYKGSENIIYYGKDAANVLVVLLCLQRKAIRNIKQDSMQILFINENQSGILDIRDNYQAARRIKHFLEQKTEEHVVRPRYSTYDLLFCDIKSMTSDQTSALAVQRKSIDSRLYPNEYCDTVDASEYGGKHDWTGKWETQSNIEYIPIDFHSPPINPFISSTLNIGNIKRSENEPETRQKDYKDGTLYPDVHVQTKSVEKTTRNSIVGSGSHRRRTLTGRPFMIEKSSTMAKTDNSSQGMEETVADIEKGIDKSIVQVKSTEDLYL